MNKKGPTILLTVILIVSLGVVGGFWYKDKKGNIKKESIAEQQIDNYQHDIINVLLENTDEVVRNVDTSDWKEFKNSNASISFQYPENLKILNVSNVSEEEKAKFLKRIKKKTGLNAQAGAIDIDFYDEINERIGFLRGINFFPYSEYELLMEEGGFLDVTRTYKINRRKNNRVHPKSYESVGYVRSGGNIFPWTVVDAGYKDVFSMSDILYYNEDTDSFVSIEIRMFDYDEETKDILYGILKTVKFN